NVSLSADSDGRGGIIHGLGGALIDYDGLIGSVNINGGSGGNKFNVDGTVLNVTTNLNTGTGIDTVNVKGTQGALVVNGQSGHDTVNITESNAQTVKGGVTITNSGSFTALNVNDSSTAGRNVTMGVGSDRFGFIKNLTPGQIRYFFNDVSAVRVNA